MAMRIWRQSGWYADAAFGAVKAGRRSVSCRYSALADASGEKCSIFITEGGGSYGFLSPLFLRFRDVAEDAAARARLCAELGGGLFQNF